MTTAANGLTAAEANGGSAAANGVNGASAFYGAAAPTNSITSRLNGFNHTSSSTTTPRSTTSVAETTPATTTAHDHRPHCRREDGASHPQAPAQTHAPTFEPIAICGMACRLPGGVASPQDLWDLIISKRDASSRIPESRYNISGYHWPSKKPGLTITEEGYFLDETVDLGALDTTSFPMSRAELEVLDPQQRILLEVSRESIDDAGETGWRGKEVGVFVGSFGNDWYDLLQKESQRYGTFYVTTSHDFAISNRISHEMDLRGPSMTIRTACSSSLVALNEACSAIAKGDCPSAIVGGTSIIMAPALTTDMSNQGTLSPDGSCKTFSAHANGYARGEGVVAIYVKPLKDALRDGNPVRAVVVGAATNCDGHTPTFMSPSSDAQEALIRRTYALAGISDADLAKTGFFECHGTGTPTGDPIETAAIARIFGHHGGVHIGSIKPNLGHGEGVSGLTSILKAVLSLENQTIAPNIKCLPLNGKIPFDEGHLTVPTEPTPWPAGRHERVSVNSFGIGGSNAHVILDSARSFPKPPQRLPVKRESPDAPQLLVFSANSSKSLTDLTTKYTKFLEAAPEELPLRDVAYTLANRREHLPFRSFAVGTKYQAGTPSPPTQCKTNCALIMAFTGQGAQWPQMGRELLRTNTVFRDTIRALDIHLQALPVAKPDWKLETEIARPTRTSRVNEAEFSQPLCTALQIALVDTLSSSGVKPSAVVGHSSGEIAAAYAAGALSARDAIAVAYYRGLITTRSTRSGAMAAVGLSWDETEKYLRSGVVVACDNSPRSVTISGDAEPLADVVAAIKAELPDASTTVLKVEKAYHSHHMVEVGREYHDLMAAAGIKSTPPSIPFYSSVLGRLLFAVGKGDQLGPRYWQTNLESPVLFNFAVANLISKPPPGCESPVFLEIGPHSALSGPLRQILTSKSSTAPYVPIMKRRENSLETLLEALGRLWTLNVTVDFAALIPNGRTLPDLPRYSWNHQRTYWRESRVAKEWRMTEHLYHDLLGAKVPESSALEPVWRNLLHLDNAPWIRDHLIHDNIIFPFAGYVAMAAEAVRQVSGMQEAAELRNITVNTALVVNEEAPTEMVTTLRKHRLTNALDSQWWDFTITAYNGHSWTKHCFGQVSASAKMTFGRGNVPDVSTTPHRVDKRQWYERVKRGGLRYGHHFTTLEQIRTSTSGPRGLGSATMNNNWHGDEDRYHMHPVVLDSIFQLVGAAAHHGFTHAYQQAIPSGAAYIALSRSAADKLTLGVSCESAGNSIVGNGSCVVDSEAVMTVTNVRFSHLESTHDTTTDRLPITARSEWVPHADLIDVNVLVKPVRDHSTYFNALEELAGLAVELSRAELSNTESPVQAAHFERYKEWIKQHHTTDAAGLRSRFDSLYASLVNGPASDVAIPIAKLCNSASAIFSGKAGALDVLNTDGSLDKLHEFLGGYDPSDLVRCLAQSQPNLRILELGTGTTPIVTGIIDSLKRPDGQLLYSQYVYADQLTGMTNIVQERLKGFPHLEFVNLDISKDPAAQGFQDRRFDLILASGVVHGTANLGQTLQNLRQLLSPDGRLLLQQPRAGLKWLKYLLGSLPGWWVGAEDNRSEEPYVSVDRWDDELLAAGFRGLNGAVVPDSANLFHLNTVMIARARWQEPRTNRVSILGVGEATELEKALGAQGFQVTRTSLDQRPPEGEDIIVTLDKEGPFLKDIDGKAFEGLKSWVQHADYGKAGIFWVTKPSQIGCQDPRYAPIIGLSRTLRSELGIDFATCETADIESEAGAQAVVDVFRQFHERGTERGQDFEYAITDGVARVNRFYPYEIEQDVEIESANNRVTLRIDTPGRLDSLQWAPRQLQELKENDVEIEVHAVGLNFRDVLEAMGIIGVVDNENSFGLEASGIVKRVGPNVSKFVAGDRVVATGTGAFSTLWTTSELLCDKLPENISFADGASMLVVYLTAIYALVNLGRLEEGQSVLIHSGCGGVGLASIQVARALGAEIYTTVGSDEKVQYLMDNFGIPRSHIFNSRNSSFVEDILRDTKGHGVDLALNSLSGELLHATWRSVAKWGTMVEIGKVDLLGAGRLDMDMFLGSRSYSCFDLRQMAEERPQMISRLLAKMMSFFKQGLIKPVGLAKESAASNVLDAFREMQKGSHIGKIVISLRDRDGNLDLGDVAAASKGVVSLDPSGTYLLIGGLGGLGRSISAWMAQHGARHLTLLSRNAGTEEDEEFTKMLSSMGCAAQLIRGSVENEADIVRAVDGASAPIKGIIHMGMVLRDEAFPRMTIDDWNAATRPKIDGAWNLHKVSQERGLDLDFFILFSSLSGVLGQSGQANYAAANTFLDALAQHREGLGLPCTALDIGAMEGVGYLARHQELLRKMRGTGWNPVKEEELLQVLGATMLAPHGRVKQQGTPGSLFAPLTSTNTILVGVSPNETADSGTRLSKDVRMAAYLNGGKVAAGSSGNDSLRAFLASAKNNPSRYREADAAGILAHEIGKKLFALLLKPDEEANVALGLAELGLDSLIAVEMRAWFKQAFALDISVLEMLAMGTLEALGKKIAGKLAELHDV
ncbi:hypothetical protein S40288_07716 [Stachybotrys chartarum IBT 40288]|nr:hypothetical protein S40288_07716 [Stachybotrys chartarum IBT 40288]